VALDDDKSSSGAACGATAESSRSRRPVEGGLGKLGDAAAWRWVFDARGRVGLVIAGDLVLMHRSGLAAPKALYLLVAIVAAVAALPAVRDVFRDHSRTADRRLILAAAAVGALAVLSLPVALYHHNALSDWIRDVGVYGLLAVAPALAIDLRRSAGVRWVSWALIASGALAAISFAVYWATARGYTSLPGRRDLLLPTWYLAAAFFAYASARAIRTVGRERMTWALVAFAVFLSSTVTGTRSSVIMLAAPIAQLLLSRHRRALAVVVCGVAVVAAAFSVAQSRGVDLGSVGNRLSTAATFVRHPGTDPSWKLRLAETHNALHAWRTSPVLGVGAGHIFHWTTSGIHEGSFLIDSPAGFLAKFGLVGVLVLLGFLVAAALVVRQRLRSGALDSVLPLVGLGAVVLCGFVFGMPFEDKGFPVAFLLTYALTLPGAPDPTVPDTQLRRRASTLAVVLGVVCVIAAATGSRIGTGSLKPSILGATSPPVHVIASYEKALWDGDGSRACGLLAPSMRARRWGSRDRCRVVLSKARGTSVFADSRASAPVLVRSNPRTLEIPVHRTDGTTTLYRVARRRGGRWIIVASKLVPHP
jgi:O-Antigen ligase